ncbi:hypothetical protein [Altererythrobacter sp. ZODW24]|uniref:hypothetical protein n=1 Tax=Altererythrobacter sp. ZODW24 TaxID=2185142 RepID=UPI000DF84806|nr:hypothetical protein [Altererythrobacter sp. ZODW24]
MMKHTFTAIALVTLANLGTTSAFAQAVPDIDDAINRSTSIDESLRGQERTTPRFDGDEDGEIAGEAGIFVLSKNEIFYIGAAVGTGWAENPLRTADDVGDSFYANAAFTAGLQTKIAEAFDFGLAATVSGTEYDAAFAPSSRTLNVSTNLGSPIKGTPLYVGGGIYGGFSYDGNFERGTGFYGANVALSAGGPIGPKTLARASLSAVRSGNEISDNDAWSGNFDIAITQIVAPKVTIGAQTRLSYFVYDDFFEDVTFVERQDWQIGGNVNANWSPLDWLSVSVSAGYQKRDSRFFLSDYDGFETALTIAARKRF